MTDTFSLLAPWQDLGVLDVSDVHLAATLARLGGLETDTGADAALLPVVLAAALAARGPRHGHVCLDLRTVRTNVAFETEPGADDAGLAALDELPWPTHGDWVRALAESSLVEVVDRPSVAGPERPMVLDGTLLYLSRYRHYESQVAEALLDRSDAYAEPLTVSAQRRDELLDQLDPSEEQRRAALVGATRALGVVLGGPGTGKTHTIATILALLLDAAPDRFRIALAAPTGKAAARMGESITRVATELRATDLTDAVRLADRMIEVAATPLTLHRLLGHNPGRGTWRHDHANPLVHDVVIVDETSMVSLPMMARLLDAVRPDARLVLVGDPGQLASVEAGSVLSDIAAGAVAGEGTTDRPLAECIIELTESYRFPRESPVGRFAAAVRRGDAADALEVLADSTADTDADTDTSMGDDSGVRIGWHEVSADRREAVAVLADLALPAVRRLHEAAVIGDATAALAVLDEQRVLCAHRLGPFGIGRWNRQFEEWLGTGGVRTNGFYPGRPVLVTANDATRRLFNGDLGVVVNDDGVEQVVFGTPRHLRRFAPSQLEAVETVHAMTIHKSQGSEFDHVIVILPPATSRLATRELLYTAVTRARRTVTLVGSADAIAAAIGRRVERASGLATRLWTD
ncbi:MAG: exodeoxyribonuclease V subunit alpha [Acidimicrobiia bacterium]|nr:exodeoxyribonuclease V subunit alpha [Acidimicrobiia bacterium]